MSKGKMTQETDGLLPLSDYDAFGFDLDHTLAKYNLVESFKLTYKAMTDFLINEKGYSKELAKDIEVDKDFCTKGLVLDADRGNVLKLAYDGKILRASHGTLMLEESEIQEIYGKEKNWEQFPYLKEHVNSGTNYRIFENYFDMPGIVISARIVDILDKEAGKSLKKYSFWEDVFAAFNNTYRYQAFSENNGGYFPNLKASPEKYLRKCNEKVKNWLKSLKKQGKFVFLMTSSYIDFATLTAEYVLGAEWKSYFDLCITFARKPSFYFHNKPFLRIDGDMEKEPVTDLQENQCYSQGNIKLLNNYIAKATGKPDPKVVYFGDSLRSDVFPSKAYGDWGVVLIIEEMEAEGYTLHDLNISRDSEDEVTEPKPKRRRHEDIRLSTLGPLEKDFLLSDEWGSFFTDDADGITIAENLPGQHQHMNTFWGWVISQYSDIAIPNMEYITELPLSHRFKSFRSGVDSQDMLGFHPGVPLSLKKYEDLSDQ